jgi:hypothetical protein
MRSLLIELTIIVGLGLLLALLGPFGSFSAPLSDRLVYWMGLGVGGYLLFRPAMMAATATARRLDLPEAATWTAACLLAAVPMSLVVWLVSPGRPQRVPSLDELVPHYANVALISAAVTLVFWFVSRGERMRGAPQPSAPTTSPPTAPPLLPAELPSASEPLEPRFLARLPLHVGRDLIALEMEDHYVRAHTSAGSTLVLMRMRDAVAELDGLDGRQVHRSWWVARSAVDGELQDGRNLRLKLKGGLEAPVARSRVSELQLAGWLRRT